MIVKFDKNFIKDLKKLKDKELAQKIKTQILVFEKAKEIVTLSNIKKLKGFEYYYRLKIGDYRLGFSFIDDEITLIRFIHRKDIYKYFP